MYQVVTPNERMMNAYQNILYGKPDCCDVQSEHSTLPEAEAAAKKFHGRVIIRLADDPSPAHMISEFYCIDPDREPELAKRVQEEWQKWEEETDRQWGISKAAASLGSRGGSSRSEAKQAASRANGKLGGRPRKPGAGGLSGGRNSGG